MIDKSRATTKTNSYTHEFFSWEHAFDQDYNTDKKCIDVFNFSTRTRTNRLKSAELPILSKVELFSNLLNLEDFLIINTLGKSACSKKNLTKLNLCL